MLLKSFESSVLTREESPFMETALIPLSIASAYVNLKRALNTANHIQRLLLSGNEHLIEACSYMCPTSLPHSGSVRLSQAQARARLSYLALRHLNITAQK